MLDNRVKTLPNQPTLAQERLSTAVLRELHRRPSHCMVAALPPLYHNKLGAIEAAQWTLGARCMTENIETLLKESRLYRPTAQTVSAA